MNLRLLTLGLLIGWGLWTPLAGQKAPVPLPEVDIEEVEIGTWKDNRQEQIQTAPGRINYGDWAVSGFWNDDLKIVPKALEVLVPPPGTPYQSTMTDVFAVKGQPVAGVGLWARRPLMYHWIEFEIPAGAKSFTAKVSVTDDPFGYARGFFQTVNQQFTFAVEVDGREVFNKFRERFNLADGSGARLAEFQITLPPGSQVIRLWLRNGVRSQQTNFNVELVVSEGLFRF
ncbi:MAG: hypothetical protein SFY92_09870 [Verrucomicrobiae bacterium]|nr:hypothetical protein [Verrucomicrobiae bacterium]